MKTLRKAVEDYIALRRSLGFKLRDMATGLADFVSFLEQKAAPHITTALALEWATQPGDSKATDGGKEASARRWAPAVDLSLFIWSFGRRWTPHQRGDQVGTARCRSGAGGPDNPSNQIQQDPFGPAA